MGARTGNALRGLKLFLRAIQFCCAALILAIFSYFLATLSNHGLPTATWIRAVEGISGIAVLYTVACILTLCCFPSAAAAHPFTSLASMVLDVAFASAFIYVAAANKGGSGSCTGVVDTPFGTGDADSGKQVEGNQDGFTALPSLKQACQMETACLAVAVVAIFFFLFSILAELALIRHYRKERRFGPSPANDYPSGYTKPPTNFFSRLFSRKRKGAAETDGMNPNALPEHAHPDDIIRSSYATEQTRVGTADGGNNGPYEPKYESPGYEGHDIGITGSGRDTGTGMDMGMGNEARWDEVPLAAYPPANYRYSDGVYDRV